LNGDAYDMEELEHAVLAASLSKVIYEGRGEGGFQTG